MRVILFLLIALLFAGRAEAAPRVACFLWYCYYPQVHTHPKLIRHHYFRLHGKTSPAGGSVGEAITKYDSDQLIDCNSIKGLSVRALDRFVHSVPLEQKGALLECLRQPPQ